MIKKTLAVLVVAVAMTTSALADIASPFPLTNTRYGPAGTKGRAVVAARGTDFLVAVQTLTDVRVTRLVRAPLPTAPLPVPVLTNYTDRTEPPALVATAGGYFLAGTRNGNAVGRFLDPAGQPVSPEFTIVTGAERPRVAVAANGRMLMLYTTGISGILRAAVLDESAHALADFVLSNDFDQNDRLRFDVASNGADFLAVSAQRRGIRAFRINMSGQVTEPTIIDSEVIDDRFVAAGSDGHDYIVAWSRPSKGTLLTTFLTGTNPPTPSWTIAETADKRAVTFPDLTWSGTEYLATYTTRGTFMGRLRNDGSALSSPQALSETPADTSWSSVAASADGALALWSLADPILSDPLPAPFAPLGGVVYGRYLAGGPSGSAFVALNAAPEETKIATASGTGILVTWVDVTAERQAVMAGIEGADGGWNEIGELLRSTTVPISSLLATTDGANYLVIATVAGQSSAVRVASSGVVLTNQPIALPMTVTSVAWTGSNYALVGVDQSNLQGMLLGPAGDVVKVPSALRPPRDLEGVASPVVAGDGTGLLIAWNNGSPCQLFILCPPDQNITARRFSAQLTTVDTTELKLGYAFYDSVPAIAWNGARYLVAWNNGISGGSAIMARQISSSGVPDPSTLTLATRTSNSFSPVSIASAGPRFGVAFRTRQSSGGYEPQSAYLSLVEGDGSVGSPVSYDLTAMGTALPVVTASGGSFVIASTVVTSAEPYHGSERIFLRWLDSTPRPTAPQLLKAEIANGRAVLQWSTVAGAGGYRFEYKVGEAPWKEADRFFPSSSNAVDIGGIKAGYPYRFRIRAWSRGGVSAYSNERSVTLTPRPRTAG
jgi:hypothetical protein